MNWNRTTIRAAVRSLVAVATAFGLGFTAEQVAAIQVALEAVLQIVYKDKESK